MNFPGKDFIFAVILTLTLLNLADAAVILKNNGTETIKGKGQTQVRVSETIIHPTNVFKEEDGSIGKERDSHQKHNRDLRPFEWLHKHLSDYLLCAYKENVGCEDDLLKAIKADKVNGRFDDLKRRGDRGFGRPKDSGPFLSSDRPHERFVVVEQTQNKDDERTNLLKGDGESYNGPPPHVDQPFDFGPHLNGNFHQQPPMPFFFNDRMQGGGPHTGPHRPDRNPGGWKEPYGRPWDQQPMPDFPKGPKQSYPAFMGLPFFFNMH